VATQPYQICLYIGPKPEFPATTFVDITPAADTPSAVLAAIESSGLTAADLRTRTLFVSDTERAVAAAMTYAALIGFAGRRLDFTAVGDGSVKDIVVATSLHNVASGLEGLDSATDPITWVQVGIGLPSVRSVAFGSELGVDDVSAFRTARRCRVAVAGLSAYDLLTALVTVSAFRVRNGADRLPALVETGSVPLETIGDDGEAVVNGIDLDALRRSGGELRRSKRLDDRNALVDPVNRGVRIERITAAAALPVELALTLLGSTMQSDTELWHCPRPQRHRNGDANASMKVADGKIRCFRCDPEPVDGLRLVCEVRNVTPDDAANLLLANA
jgi:hypothetical protein